MPATMFFHTCSTNVPPLNKMGLSSWGSSCSSDSEVTSRPVVMSCGGCISCQLVVLLPTNNHSHDRDVTLWLVLYGDGCVATGSGPHHRRVVIEMQCMAYAPLGRRRSSPPACLRYVIAAVNVTTISKACYASPLEPSTREQLQAIDSKTTASYML